GHRSCSHVSGANITKRLNPNCESLVPSYNLCAPTLDLYSSPTPSCRTLLLLLTLQWTLTQDMWSRNQSLLQARERAKLCKMPMPWRKMKKRKKKRMARKPKMSRKRMMKTWKKISLSSWIGALAGPVLRLTTPPKRLSRRLAFPRKTSMKTMTTKTSMQSLRLRTMMIEHTENHVTIPTTL
ncbi:hypothetical protein M407DRAFT_146714, partial [Tulasnella calospora MUT 4182]